MELIGEVIDEIQSRYSKGVRSTDSRLSNRLIYTKMIELRATLIVQKSNKNQILSDVFYQLLSGLETQKVSKSMLSTFKLKENITETRYEIPALIYDIDSPLIESVSNIDASVLYNRTSWQTVKNSSGRKYTGDKPVYFLLNNKVYLSTNTGPRAIAVRAIFKDPIEPYLIPIYENCGTASCTPYMSMFFHTDTNMVNTIVEMTAAHFIELYTKQKDDREQNDIDNT